jgi:ankyrin repeat protein
MSTSLDRRLLAAVNEGKLKLVRSLLRQGADPNTTNCFGLTPLHTAVYMNRADIVQTLLKAGADANATNNWIETPLHFAARAGYYECTKLLLKAGADVNAQDRTNRDTPLHLACEKNDQQHHRCTRLLLEAGAHKNIKNRDNLTPLECLSKKSRMYKDTKKMIEEFRYKWHRRMKAIMFRRQARRAAGLGM